MYNVQRQQHSPADRLVVLLYVVDLTCFSHTTKWRCRERSSTGNTILFPLKAYGLWNLCKTAASVRWRWTTRQCWLSCRSTLQRNCHNFIRLDGDFTTAQPHIVNHIMQFLAKFNIICVLHPPYNPDHALCDIILFPSIKAKLWGIQFETSEAMLKKGEAILKALTKNGCVMCSGNGSNALRSAFNWRGGGILWKRSCKHWAISIKLLWEKNCLSFCWSALYISVFVLDSSMVRVHRCGASGSMRACHVVGPCSIPGRDKFPGWGFFGVFPHL